MVFHCKRCRLEFNWFTSGSQELPRCRGCGRLMVKGLLELR